MNGPYYPSVLLNEIHYYFPAILYDPERFRNFSDLQEYLTTMMREHFDIYSNARHQYFVSQPVQTPPPRQQPTSPPPLRRHTDPLRNAQPLRSYDSAIPDSQDDANTNAMVQLLMSFANHVTGSGIDSGSGIRQYTVNLPEWSEPVIVRPSAAVLERATTVSVLSVDTDGICAVCQDSMNLGATVRKINTCGHTFHRTCVDTWFQTNVHCPTCRHDIRTATRLPTQT